MTTATSNDRIALVGIDPGVVHSGVVRFEFQIPQQKLLINFKLFNGLECDEIVRYVKYRPYEKAFIEKYQPRSHFSWDTDMQTAVIELKKRLPHSRVLLNTGVKKVITDALMRTLDVWQFPAVSHHQDLRAAARIGLYGMVKDPEWNQELYRMVEKTLFTQDPWKIERKED